MNLYVVVEGRRTEPKLYRTWLPFLRPGITEIQRLEDARADDEHFLLISGNGYPNYKDTIRQAGQDILECTAAAPFTLLVAVDAEDATAEGRRAEIEQVIPSGVPAHVVVADCCIESWLLGNENLIPRRPDDSTLSAWMQHYNVRDLDPELMPAHPAHTGSRADFHLQYLRRVFEARHSIYTKRAPGPATERHFWDALTQRVQRTDPLTRRAHLRSFSTLLTLQARFPPRPSHEATHDDNLG
jgi:hypothetical protein